MYLAASIDYLPNGKVLPIAQAYTEANGTADAANTTHTLVTQSRRSYSTDRRCRRRCGRRRTRPLEATKQKI